ncbi:hypothetical protein OG900_02815 [Streptomyces sp. NBC_00433]
MNTPKFVSARSAAVVAATAMASVVAMALPAAAHTPVILTAQDQLPWVAPLVVDGTDPMGLYGSVSKAGEVRSAQLHFTAGQEVSIALVIPDEAPENTLTTAQLPTVTLIDPQLHVTQLTPALRVPITDEDSGNNFLLLLSYDATAVSGTYSVIVSSHAAERFALSTGIESEEFHGVLRATVATEDAVEDWYTTPPAIRNHHHG